MRSRLNICGRAADHKTAKNGIAYVKRYELLAAIVAQRSEV